jgi:uncharacterized protein YbjT (DUF2867 family)
MLPKLGESILVTGGTSALGDILMPRLLARFPEVTVIVRSEASRAQVARHSAKIVEWDLESGTTAPRVRASHLLHIGGIRHASAACQLALSAGAKHIVAISSASASAPGHPNRGWVRAGEDALSSTGVATTILRPTMIYGSPRDRNVRRLYSLLQRLPAIPRFVGGGLMMPVFADDLASAIEECIARELTGTRAVAGPAPLTFGSMVGAIAKIGHLRQLPVTVPVPLLSFTAKRLTRISGSTTHALQMLALDRVVDTPGAAGFDYSPTTFADGLALALPRYKFGTLVDTDPSDS